MKRINDFIFCAILACNIGVFSANVEIGQNGEFRVDGDPFFPIMQFLQSPSSVSTEALYGINLFCMSGFSSTTAIEWCSLMAVNNVYGAWKYNKTEATDEVINHSAFFGWFFQDEPDIAGNEISPDSIQSQYNEIKAIDPNHPTFLTLTSRFYSKHHESIWPWMNGSDSLYYEYTKHTDVVGFDLYPVYGWCRPEWIYQVGDAMSELKNNYIPQTKRNMPKYAWIEAVDRTMSKCSIDGRTGGLFTNETEAQVWLAIIHGAKAIGYWTHSLSDPFDRFFVTDTMRTTITRINEKITSLTNVLCGPDLGSEISVSAKGMGGNDGRIDVLAKKYGQDSVYIIAANVLNYNDAADTQVVTYTLPGVSDEIAVYGENRTVSSSSESGTFTDTFTVDQPVHIYAMKMQSTGIKGSGQKQNLMKKKSRKINIMKRIPVNGAAYDLRGARISPSMTGRNSASPVIIKKAIDAGK